ncbi:RNase H domain-containing protein [Trichonephila clavipes]|uniref:RNase H domain-containing protein n=1 Tax=Trichonephila clavipes TaxID=2585209 RepID=A0A8X6SX73_TRICX|nr:RNase H domain-containing protein [Trichonephila clavipes]
MSIWILSGSRNAFQHLSNWNRVGDKTGTSILNKLKQVPSSCDVHFQWIPSYVDIWGNEEAEPLGKHIDKKIWLVPPVHTWYRADSPGMNYDRCTQMAVSTFLSGHLRSLASHGGHKTHPICPKCNIEQA